MTFQADGIRKGLEHIRQFRNGTVSLLMYGIVTGLEERAFLQADDKASGLQTDLNAARLDVASNSAVSFFNDGASSGNFSAGWLFFLCFRKQPDRLSLSTLLEAFADRASASPWSRNARRPGFLHCMRNRFGLCAISLRSCKHDDKECKHQRYEIGIGDKPTLMVFVTFFVLSSG